MPLAVIRVIRLGAGPARGYYTGSSNLNSLSSLPVSPSHCISEPQNSVLRNIHSIVRNMDSILWSQHSIVWNIWRSDSVLVRNRVNSVLRSRNPFHSIVWKTVK